MKFIYDMCLLIITDYFESIKRSSIISIFPQKKHELLDRADVPGLIDRHINQSHA